jgi:hypothetical protein
MNQALKFLEEHSFIDQDNLEIISLLDAITALKIQELETLKAVENNTLPIIERINELSIFLKKLKLN